MKNYYDIEKSINHEDEYREFILNNIIINYIKKYFNKMQRKDLDNITLDSKVVTEDFLVAISFGKTGFIRNTINYNHEDFASFCAYLETVIKDYNLGKIGMSINRSNPIFNTLHVYLNTSLNNLIKAYKDLSDEILIDFEQKFIDNKEYIENNYYENLGNEYYDLFLNNLIVKIIEGMVYSNIDFNKKCKWNMEVNTSTINSSINYDSDIIKIHINEKTFDDFIMIIDDFLKKYQIGKMQKNGRHYYNLDLNANLNELLYAYYMESQRLDYYKEEELVLK